MISFWLRITVQCLALLTLASVMQAHTQTEQSPTTEVTRASIQAYPSAGKPGNAVVRITNLSKVPIVAWKFELTFTAGDRRPQVIAFSMDHFFSLTDRPEVGSGPIQPKETRQLLKDIDPTLSMVDAARLVMVSFVDGSFEGDRNQATFVTATRAGYALELGYWLDVFDELAPLPAPEAKSILTQKVSARRKALPVPGLPRVLAEEVYQSLEQIAGFEDVSFRIVLMAQQQRYEVLRGVIAKLTKVTKEG